MFVYITENLIARLKHRYLRQDVYGLNIDSKNHRNLYSLMSIAKTKVLILHQSKVSGLRWKVLKRALKNLSVCIWMGGSVSVCVCVCLYVCLSARKTWITFDGMKGSWWNFQDHSNPIQVIFGQVSQISQPPGHSHGPRQPVSINSISSLSFCPTGVWYTHLETPRLRPVKIGSKISNFVVGFEHGGTHRKKYILEFDILT